LFAAFLRKKWLWGLPPHRPGTLVFCWSSRPLVLVRPWCQRGADADFELFFRSEASGSWTCRADTGLRTYGPTAMKGLWCRVGRAESKSPWGSLAFMRREGPVSSKASVGPSVPGLPAGDIAGELGPKTPAPFNKPGRLGAREGFVVAGASTSSSRGAAGSCGKKPKTPPPTPQTQLQEQQVALASQHHPSTPPSRTAEPLALLHLLVLQRHPPPLYGPPLPTGS
jgi:hypothetical protein